MFELLSQLPNSLLASIATVFGLLVGSFLNVVIYRLPKQLKYEWSQQSYEWLNNEEYTEAKPNGIAYPASHCQHCKTPIKAWHNIPVISWLLLKGQCASCSKSISIRYPIVEALTGLLTYLVILKFGWSIQSIGALILTWSLVALTFIDFDEQLLPDNIVLPVLWLGLGLNAYSVYASPKDALLGAIAGYLALWIVFQIFKLLTKKDGMGFGDFKLLSLFGAWLGWQYLPQIILISSALGSVVGLALIITGKLSRDKPMAFGPYIALAGWLAFIWGDAVNNWYLGISGF
jgi:leader peptidase (prepilin peptidase)/N-methyltransferase